MNPEERDAVLATTVGIGGERRLSLEAFPRVTGIADPRTWALDELVEAVERHDVEDVQLAMQVGAAFGMDDRWVEPLISVLEADWSESHEDSAFGLGKLQDPRAVPALLHATYWVPGYLEWDEERSLAVKAIHALGEIPGPEARAALTQLRQHEDRPLRRRVERVLARSQEPGE